MQAAKRFLSKRSDLWFLRIISSISTILLVLAFAYSVWQVQPINIRHHDAYGNVHIERNINHAHYDNINNGAFYGTWCIFFVLNYFFVIFCNASITACVLLDLEGKPCSVEDGMRMASKRIYHLFLWSCIAASIGMLLKMFESVGRRYREGPLGALGGIRDMIANIPSIILGTSWNIGVTLVLPIIVMENYDPITAMSRSFRFMKTYWKQQLTVLIYTGLPIIAICIIFYMAAHFVERPYNVWMGGMAFAAIIAVHYYLFTAFLVYDAMLYRYHIQKLPLR